MLKLLVLSVAVAAVWGSPRADKPSFKKFGSGRIVGGKYADISDYPYQLALTKHGFLSCGASKIGSKWALTAAHCTDGTTASTLYVQAGSTDLKDGQFVQVATIYQHPLYDPVTVDYDVSVLELTKDITVENSAPIALHGSGYTAEEGANITITGWGDLSEDGRYTYDLQAVVTKVVSNEVCNEAYGALKPVTDRIMCAGEAGKDSCYGDSGGPLVVDGKQYGIVSWGLGCARPGFPGVNVKVSDASIREFIKNITGL